MATKRNIVKSEERTIGVRVPIALLEDYRKVIARDERTLSQDLRRYMAERIEAEGEVAA